MNSNLHPHTNSFKKHETRDMLGWNEKFVHSSGHKPLNKTYQLVLYGSIILKRKLEKYGKEMWTEFIRFRAGTVVVILKHCNVCIFMFHVGWDFSHSTGQLTTLKRISAGWCYDRFNNNNIGKFATQEKIQTVCFVKLPVQWILSL